MERQLYNSRMSPGRLLSRHMRIAGSMEDWDDDDDESYFDDEDEFVIDEDRPEVERPPMYKVMMLNDDYTPMDFVVEVLESFFRMDREQATRVMLTVHTRGRAECGVFSQDIAETKAAKVVEYARKHQHPLMCRVEKV